MTQELGAVFWRNDPEWSRTPMAKRVDRSRRETGGPQDDSPWLDPTRLTTTMWMWMWSLSVSRWAPVSGWRIAQQLVGAIMGLAIEFER